MELLLHYLLVAVILALSVGILFGLIQTIRGPKRADRILGINMIGSFSIAEIAVVAVFLRESWLLDVCLVYCLISFLAVVILSKIHIIEKDDPKSDLKGDSKNHVGDSTGKRTILKKISTDSSEEEASRYE